MKTYIKALGFITLGILVGVSAKVIPQQQITVTSLEAVKRPEVVAPLPSISVASLLKQYRSRPLFTSKLENNADTLGSAQPNIIENWSPLDYQLIGISRTANQTTGWFKHIETGGLISSRKGMRLGNWTLDYLSSTEARLSSNNKTESLKLFQREEPR